MQTIVIKAGESYSQAGAATTDGTTPIDLTGYTATSQVRDTAGTLVGEFVVAIDAGADGTFLYSAAAAVNATWTVGTHLSDIRLVGPSGNVIVSPTFAVRVTTAITIAEEA